MDWIDEKLHVTDFPMFNGLRLDFRQYVFPKERNQQLWDHIVDIFISLEGTILSLCIFFHSLKISLNRGIISIVKLVHQELYMKHYYFLQQKEFYTKVFKYLILLIVFFF